MNASSDLLLRRLAALPPEALPGMRRGLEKESLRAAPDGALALTPHPAALGSPLTHPHITTDFSESQPELVTGTHGSVQACLDELRQIHQVVYAEMAALGDEMLWASSMPCKLPPDEMIPLGYYGTSNVGRAKSVYRMGLGHRYGRRMQTISGIHYNWSLPGAGSEQYFGLIRNFRRHAFLLLYLFGASPVVCGTFVQGRQHALQPLGSRAMYLPHATSLRMGRLGYQSDAQSTLAVSYNGLEGYAASLQDALTRPWPAYEAIGIQAPSGDYNQLAVTLLQIENEFYGTIRPKRVIEPGEMPTILMISGRDRRPWRSRARTIARWVSLSPAHGPGSREPRGSDRASVMAAFCPMGRRPRTIGASRRDRSSSVPRSVEFRVEIGPLPYWHRS